MPALRIMENPAPEAVTTVAIRYLTQEAATVPAWLTRKCNARRSCPHDWNGCKNELQCIVLFVFRGQKPECASVRPPTEALLAQISGQPGS